MWKYLNSFHKIFFIFWFISGCITPQKKESDNIMPEFYRDNITNPISVDNLLIDIALAKDINLSQDNPEEYNGGYFFRYLNPEKNSRLLSKFKPNRIWEVKWRSALDSTLLPWFILLGNDRIIVQNESGWQLFDTDGKHISSSSRTNGNLSIDIINGMFYQNEFSGFLAANNLSTGKPEYFVYPLFGQGYDRNIVWYNGFKFLCVGYGIPQMTHKSSPKDPDITLFEILDVRDKSMIDSDKILNSANQIQKLILKAENIKTAVSKGEIAAASEDFISVIDTNLDVKKIFQGKFIPLEMSLDKQFNIYLIVKVIDEDNSIKYFLWLINQNGEMIFGSELPVEEKNPEFYPPIVGYNLNSFIITGNKLFSIDSKGKINWDKYLSDASPGAVLSANGYLLTSEGNMLSAFDSNGERHYIFQFESENLFSTPILSPQNEILVATQNFLYCLKVKD